MKKILHLEPYFPTGELTVQPVVLWSGHKSFVEPITKHASVGHDYFKTIQPVPGHSIVYVLAVSAYETYGENKNGDSFPEFPYKEAASPPWIGPEETLPRHYKTFEQYGHNYRHHCFPAGTPVLMADRTRKPIDEVREGDTVITLDGPRAITTVMKRPYKGAGVQLKLKGECDSLIGTDDHPVQIYKREQVHCPHKYSYLAKSKPYPNGWCNRKECVAKKGQIGKPEWAPLSSILPGDYMVLPQPKHGTEKIDPAFAQLVGWVASEGYLGARGLIQFTFSDQNTEDLERVTGCLKENNLHVTITPRPQFGLTMLSACSKELHQKLSEYITGTLNHKKLLPAILQWDKESLVQMLGAYIDGDGHVAQKGKNTGQLRIRSASKSMLRVLSDIIRALGVPATIQWDAPERVMTSPTNDQQYTSSGSGVVTVNAAYAPQITLHSRKHYVRTSDRRPVCTHFENTFLVQVTEREDIFLEEDVYNLEVADVHHYVANEVVVHNCNKDPKKSVGKVMKAFWNLGMHRVELLIDLEDAKAPDLAERIKAGEFPPVSMGVRVKYDVCNACGNRAPTRAQYCEHLKFQMRDVLPSGLKVSALNPNPKFFDISWVFKPADVTAYMMKKVAEPSMYELSGAQAGEYLDVMESRKHASHKLAFLDKIIQGIPVDAKTEGIDPAELNSLIKMRDSVLCAGQNTEDFPDGLLRQLSSFPLSNVVSTMFSGGMMMNTPEFMKIVIYKSLPKAQVGDDILDNSVVLQRNILEFLEDHPQILDQLKSDDILGVAPEKVDLKIAELLDPYMEKRSGIGDYLSRRFMPETFKETYGPRTQMLTIQDPVSGRAYGTTRGAAIRAHDEIAKRNIYKILGGGALLGGAYKIIGSDLAKRGLGKFRPLVGLTLGGLGVSQLPGMGPHYMTDQGIPIPALTELSPIKQASIAAPLLGTLATMAVLGHDYSSRLERGEPIGHPALPLSRRILDQVGGFTQEHPLISAALGTMALRRMGGTLPAKFLTQKAWPVAHGMGSKVYSGVKQSLKDFAEGMKISSWLEKELPPPSGTVMLPDMNLDVIAEKIGEVIAEG